MAASRCQILCVYLTRVSLGLSNLRVLPVRTFTMTGGLNIRTTQLLCAEPPKKKKRVDPKMEMMRQQRMLKRMKKIQFKMGDPELKPVEEFRQNRKLLVGQARRREIPNLTYEENERRALLQKKWSRYKFQQHVEEMQIINTVLKSQLRALHELRVESEELYQEAVVADHGLFPFEITGPVYSPPIADYKYDSPDGEYIDVTKQYK